MPELKDILPDQLKPLSEAEEKLLGDVQKGYPPDFTTGDDEIDNPENSEKWGTDRTIRSELLVWICTSPDATPLIPPFGVQIMGAKISGNINFWAQTIQRPLGLFNSAANNIRLDYAEIHSLNCFGSSIKSLSANGLSVKGPVILDNAKTAGEVNFIGANIGGQLSCEGAELNNPAGHAFAADVLSTKEGLYLNKVCAKGEVRLLGANIGGQLACDGAEIENLAGHAFSADSIFTKGSFIFKNVKAKGTVRLIGADINGQLLLNNVEIDSPKDKAIVADGLSVERGLLLREVKVNGEVSLLGANIGIQLSCSDVKLENPGGDALNAQNLLVKGSFFFEPAVLKGRLVLLHANVEQFIDAKESWPEQGNLYIDGFEYGALASYNNADDRLQWLRLQAKEPFSVQPYEHLARVFRKIGHESDARKVLIAKQDDLRKYGKLSPLAKAWNFFLGLTVGHGYRPWRAVMGIICMWFIGMLIFMFANNLNVMQPSKERVYLDNNFIETHQLPSRYPRFNPFIYSVDVFVPFVDLHQEDYWLPDATRPWGKLVRGYFWTHIVLG